MGRTETTSGAIAMSQEGKKTKLDPAVIQHLSDVGRIGGRKSKGGGRPRIPEDQMTPAQKKRRARYEAWKKRTNINE